MILYEFAIVANEIDFVGNDSSVSSNRTNSPKFKESKLTTDRVVKGVGSLSEHR